MRNLVGQTGTIRIATRGPEGPGEVELNLNSGTQAFMAYSDKPLKRHTQVVVYNMRGAYQLDVEPLPTGEGD